MPSPVFNWVKTVAGVKLYPDYQDRKLLHYTPVRVWGTLLVSSLGQSTALRGELDFDLPQADYNAIIGQLGQVRLAPLVPSDQKQDFSIAVVVQPPHQLTVRTINSFPYPKVMFTGSLKKSEANHDQLLATIEGEWRTGSLLGGHLNVSFDMIAIEGGYDVDLRFREIHALLRNAIGGDPVIGEVAVSAVQSVVEKEFDNLATPIDSSVMQSRRTEAIGYLSQALLQALFRSGLAIYEFDDTRTIRGGVLRDPLELPVGDKLILARTSSHSLKDIAL